MRLFSGTSETAPITQTSGFAHQAVELYVWEEADTGEVTPTTRAVQAHSKAECPAVGPSPAQLTSLEARVAALDADAWARDFPAEV